MDFILSLVIIVFGILQIILFFKIWGMTNNIAEITDIIKRYQYDHNKPNVEATNQSVLENENKTETGTQKPVRTSKFIENQLVVKISTKEQMRILKVLDDKKYACVYNPSKRDAGIYSEYEIEDFDVFWAANRK